MPELSDEAGARAPDRRGGALEPVFVRRFVTGDDCAMGEGGRIDGDDLGDDHSAAALGTFGEEVDPSIGNAMAGAVVRQGRGQRNAIAQGAFAESQRAEQAREMRSASHLFLN